MGAGTVVVAVAWLELLLGLWLVPWFGRLGREVEELCLDCFFFGYKQLGGSDGVSGGSILPLELLMVHHQEDLERVERTRCQGADDVSLIMCWR